jgi:hypothetical protein
MHRRSKVQDGHDTDPGSTDQCAADGEAKHNFSF